jgi:uncharacterized protein with FMN-binding domain
MVTEQGVGVRRIVLAIGGTAAGLVMLLTRPTHAILPGGTSVATGTTNSSTSVGAAGATAGQTYDGTVASTRWGPVQVRITVRGGKVVGATALQVPSGNGRDAEINGYAVPILNNEAVSVGTANIDTVSGATVTSIGYITSLQAAINAAGLA